jgi:ABC-type nitrate/sulfonate/bicarbonate transport system substrate-binding protein
MHARRILIAALALSLSVCSSASAKMRMAWQTGDIQIQLSYALATKAFDKAGLDVELKTFPAGPAILPALAAKEIDIAWMGDFPAVTGFSNGLPITIIMMQNVAMTSTRIVANPKSGVKTLADLKGKKIGASFGSTSHGHILQALSLAGLSQKDVTLVNIAPGNMPAAYFANQIDVAVTWEPNIGQIEGAGGVRIATSQSLGLVAASVAVVRTDYLRDNAEEVKKFLKVWDDARLALLADRQATLAFEAKRLNLTMEQFNALIDRTGMAIPSYPEQLTQAYLGPVGEQKSSRFFKHISGTANLLLDLKRIEAVPPKLEELIDVRPISAFVNGR